MTNYELGMRKIVLIKIAGLLTILMGCGNLSSQTIYEDFEGAAIQTWNAVDGEYFGQESNPFPGGDNTSSGVGAYKKGIPPFSLFLATLSLAMDLSTNNQFTIQIYSPVVSAILMKLESDTGPDIEETQAITAVNQWVQYDFDFSGAAAYQDLTKIILFFNPGVTNMEDTYYFDYITAYSVTVPVQLLSLEATYHEVEKVAVIEWSTAQEVNNEKFEIQQSFNGGKWETVQAIKGRGTSQAQSNYRVEVPIRASGSFGFRLKQVDYDGRYDISRPVNILVEKDDISVYPNPARDILTIEAGSEMTISILSKTGQEVDRWSASKGKNTLDISGLPKGSYLLLDNLSTWKQQVLIH